MIAEIIATPQISLKLYKFEAEIIRNALIDYAPTKGAEFDVIQGVIDELKKIQDFEIKY